MHDLLARWLPGWTACCGFPPATARPPVFDVVVGEPGRQHELFAAVPPANLERLAAQVSAASTPTWLTVLVPVGAVPATTTTLADAGSMVLADDELFMSVPLSARSVPVAPVGYSVTVEPDGPRRVARVRTEDGTVAAQGTLAVLGSDAIVHAVHTAAEHRRRGLGRVVMGALGAEAHAAGARTGLLIATAQGAALYRDLGWSVRTEVVTATPGPTLRRASAADAEAMARAWIDSFAAALPTVRRAHDDAAVHRWFAEHVVPDLESWVAVTGPGQVVGLLVLDGAELVQLYLDPAWRGRGLGGRLLAMARHLRPTGLTLRTFQVNTAAQRFYRHHGFVETASGDGRDNEEGEPDLTLTWSPADGSISPPVSR